MSACAHERSARTISTGGQLIGSPGRALTSPKGIAFSPSASSNSFSMRVSLKALRSLFSGAKRTATMRADGTM